MSSYTLDNSDMDSSLNSKTQPRWLLAVVATLLVLLYAPTLLWLWQRWTMSVWQNGHGILVAGLVMYLVYGELQKLKHLPESANAWGFVLFIPALLLHTLDTGIHSQLLSAAALILALPALALLFLGTARTKVIVFPLLILFLTLPIPLTFTESIHLLLRHVATKGVVFLLHSMGIPVFSRGTLIEVQGGSLMVADACSGFATLYASITIAILTAYFCQSVPRKILVLLIAAPLAVGVNIVRVLILTMLVNWLGLDILKTSLHELSGLITFMVALPIIFYLGQDPQPITPPSRENSHDL
jgi:exosortase